MWGLSFAPDKLHAKVILRDVSVKSLETRCHYSSADAWNRRQVKLSSLFIFSKGPFSNFVLVFAGPTKQKHRRNFCSRPESALVFSRVCIFFLAQTMLKVCMSSDTAYNIVWFASKVWKIRFYSCLLNLPKICNSFLVCWRFSNHGFFDVLKFFEYRRIGLKLSTP